MLVRKTVGDVNYYDDASHDTGWYAKVISDCFLLEYADANLL